MGVPTSTSQGEKRKKTVKTGLEVDVGIPTLTSRGKFRRKMIKTGNEVDVESPTLTSVEKPGAAGRAKGLAGSPLIFSRSDPLPPRACRSHCTYRPGFGDDAFIFLGFLILSSLFLGR